MGMSVPSESTGPHGIADPRLPAAGYWAVLRLAARIPAPTSGRFLPVASSTHKHLARRNSSTLGLGLRRTGRGRQSNYLDGSAVSATKRHPSAPFIATRRSQKASLCSKIVDRPARSDGLRSAAGSGRPARARAAALARCPNSLRCDYIEPPAVRGSHAHARGSPGCLGRQVERRLFLVGLSGLAAVGRQEGDDGRCEDDERADQECALVAVGRGLGEAVAGAQD
jgi:hypothetical protein